MLDGEKIRVLVAFLPLTVTTRKIKLTQSKTLRKRKTEMKLKLYSPGVKILPNMQHNGGEGKKQHF